jgi:hypothetical protein
MDVEIVPCGRCGKNFCRNCFDIHCLSGYCPQAYRVTPNSQRVPKTSSVREVA